MSRRIAHQHAHDLTQAIIEQDTCANPALADLRARRVNEAFRALADDLGYRVAIDANARRIARVPDLEAAALRAAEIERAADALASIVVGDDVQSKLAYDPVFARLAQALAAYRKAKEAKV